MCERSSWLRSITLCAMDKLSPSERSRRMALVRGRNTKPELFVRCLLHRLGYRFRLHRRDLPGKPDIVLPRFQSLIFVHGCFWHGHDCRRGARLPMQNAVYWRCKISRNVARDAQQIITLERAGWRVAMVWECELRDVEALTERLVRFLKHGEDQDRRMEVNSD